MYKYLALVFLGLFCFAMPAESAKQKVQNVYVEEEAAKGHQKSLNSNLVCGNTVEPIRVGGLVTNPPFGWVNASKIGGEYIYKNDGFSYELFAKLADKLHLKIKNVGFPSFSEAVLALRKGKIDVLAGAYYDKHILGVGTRLLFPGYFKNQIIIVFPKGKEHPVRSFDDLKKLRGIVRQEEMIYSLIYQQTRGFQLEQVSGARSAYTKLLKGEADYMLTSLYAAEAEARRFKLIDDLVFTDYALIQPEFFFVLSANSLCAQQIKPLFAKALEEEQQNQQAYFSYFLTFVDSWGNRFRDDKPLTEQLREKMETPAELVEPESTEIIDEQIPVIDVSAGTPVPPAAESNAEEPAPESDVIMD